MRGNQLSNDIWKKCIKSSLCIFSIYYSFLKLTASLHLKMDGWNTNFLLGRLGLFSGANLLLVLGRVFLHQKPPVFRTPLSILSFLQKNAALIPGVASANWIDQSSGFVRGFWVLRSPVACSIKFIQKIFDKEHQQKDGNLIGFFLGNLSFLP